MGDVARAVEEVEWALAHGARLFVVRPSGVYTAEGWRSPGDAMFDPIWARLNEAHAVVIAHIGDVGGPGIERYEPRRTREGTFSAPPSPLDIAMGHNRAIENYLASLVCDRLYERFPSLRVASVENGADCLPNLVAGMKRARAQRPGYFQSDPLEQLLDHTWVAPFWEDDLEQAVRLIGSDRVLFGSDWPHAEGLPEPLSYEKVVAELDDPVATRRIMFENAAALTGITTTATTPTP
jgi:predicted TIM-barrel fold metal-dependent hydrolase